MPSNPHNWVDPTNPLSPLNPLNPAGIYQTEIRKQVEPKPKPKETDDCGLVFAAIPVLVILLALVTVIVGMRNPWK